MELKEKKGGPAIHRNIGGLIFKRKEKVPNKRDG